MHKGSFDFMQLLASRHAPAGGTVVDIGSCDVNGSYRAIFPNFRYIGIDAAAGPNVDLVATDPYRYPLPANAADIVVSGQTYEHVEFFWMTFLEMIRLTRPGGLIFLIAPSRGAEHRYPVDCWRFYPDGYRALAAWGGVEMLEVSTDWWGHPDPESAAWGDTVGAFRKPHSGVAGRVRRAALRQAMRWLMPSTRFATPATGDGL